MDPQQQPAVGDLLQRSTIPPLQPTPPPHASDEAPAVPHGLQDATAAPLSSTSSSSNLWTRVGDLITRPEARAWRRLLVRNHLNPAARLALFAANRAANTTVLEEAQQLSAKVAFKEEQQVDLVRLRAVNAALCTHSSSRQQEPSVAAHSSPNTPHSKLIVDVHSLDQLSTTMTALQQGTRWLHELHLECNVTTALPSTTLVSIAQGCPNLQVLTIMEADSCQLQPPGPEAFPNLKQLTLDVCYYSSHLAATLHSLGLYIAQLTHLSIRTEYPLKEEEQDLLPQLLCTPGTLGLHLRTLDLRPFHLTQDVLGLILTCLPALEELQVHNITLGNDDYAAAPVQWRRLQFSGQVALSSLARLPLAPGMEVVGEVGCEVVCDRTEAVTRLSAVRCSLTGTMEGNGVYLLPGQGMVAAQQPAALRAGLSLLHSLGQEWRGGKPPVLCLQGWRMSGGLMAVFPALPRWQVLCLAMPWWLPEPKSYACLLTLVPTTFRGVQLDFNGRLTTRQAEGICLGAPVGRKITNPLLVILEGCREHEAEAIRKRVESEQRYAGGKLVVKRVTWTLVPS